MLLLFYFSVKNNLYDWERGSTVTIEDRLYGSLEVTDDDLKLFQTTPLTRLRQVSLSATPYWLVPAGICASRFEHSVGVGHLARIVGQKPAFADLARDIYFAALLHDVGTPPFAHLGEHFLKILLDINHEEFAQNIIYEAELSGIIKNQGGSIENVCKLITGKNRPYSDLVNGSVDLDNLDNTLRFGLSQGIFQAPFYRPERLAESFFLCGNQLCLDEEALTDISGWEICRSRTYDFVYSPLNLIGGVMLFRALGIACREGQIPDEFFLMTDAQAFEFLSETTNRQTALLIERARQWEFYSRIYFYKTSDLLPIVKNMDPMARMNLADEISRLLAIPAEDVCVHLGRDKGYKEITVPIVAANGALTDVSTRFLKPSCNAQVYIHRRRINDRCVGAVEEFMNHTLGL